MRGGNSQKVHIWFAPGRIYCILVSDFYSSLLHERLVMAWLNGLSKCDEIGRANLAMLCSENGNRHKDVGEMCFPDQQSAEFRNPGG